MIRRYQKFTLRQDIIPAWGPSIPPPTVPAEVTQQIDRDEATRKQARARLAEHEGLDTSFVFYDAAFPLVFTGAPTAVAPVLTFTVPAGRVLIITVVEYYLSEPMCYGSQQFAWRMSIGGAQIPFHRGHLGLTLDTNFTIPLNGLGGDYQISPVYVQANETVALEVIELRFTFPTGFNEWLAGQGIIKGRLVKPTGGA